MPMTMLQIFWPLDEEHHGFIFGWRIQSSVVVCGVLPFPSHTDALIGIRELHHHVAKYQPISTQLCLSLEVFGRCNSDFIPLHGCHHDVLSSEAFKPGLNFQLITYLRPEYRSMRLYDFGGVSMESIPALPATSRNEVAKIRCDELLRSQMYFTPQNRRVAPGINSEILMLMNSASKILLALENPCLFSITGGAPTDRPSSKKVDRCAHYNCFLDLLAGAFPCSARQIKLRSEQVLSMQKGGFFDKENGEQYSSVSKYINFQNTIWLVLNDVIIGIAAGFFLEENRLSLSDTLYMVMKYASIVFIKTSVFWLDNWPAGLKLNTELSRFFFSVVIWLLALWEIILDKANVHLPAVLLTVAYSGLFGVTMLLSLLSDLIGLATLHITIVYNILGLGFKASLVAAKSLFNLFRGKRHNSLRHRLDNWNYDLDQLILGAMLFTLVSFIFPTIFMYYILFAFMKMILTVLEAGFEVALTLVNHFPLFALMLRIKDPWRVPGGVAFEQLRSDKSSYLRVQSHPISIFAMFGHYQRVLLTRIKRK